ncbi:hypothetical protein ACKGJO_00070 [Gracilimonas sp. Q87]|uniref:hypothetical protein n=1 Tax=Gracilimonas sp. Q87 TaxID=3384766 RepID=UPI003983DC54
MIRLIYNILKSFIYYPFTTYKQGDSGKVVIIINHYFDQDIKAILEANKLLAKFKLVVLDPSIFQPIRIIYPSSVRKGEIPYMHKSFDKERRWSRKFSSYLFRWLKFIYDIEIIISPSDIFYWYREFVLIANKEDIVTIVIDKEGIITPLYFEDHSKKIKNRYPLISNKIIVWSDRQKQFWIKAGTKEDKIQVIGQPRSDILLNRKESHSKYEKSILFFTYFEDAYIPDKFKDIISWKKIREETHQAIKEIADKYTEKTFIIKCHPQQQDIDVIENYFSNNKNILVEKGAKNVDKILMKAELVIGFQTTALIEAVLLDKPVVYTCWSEDYEKFKESLLPFHEFDVFVKAQSKNKLKSIVESFIDNDYEHVVNSDSKHKLLDYYLNNPSGDTSERIINYIADLTQEKTF